MCQNFGTLMDLKGTGKWIFIRPSTAFIGFGSILISGVSRNGGYPKTQYPKHYGYLTPVFSMFPWHCPSKSSNWSRTSRQQICLDLVSKALESLNPYSSPLEIPLDGSIPMKSPIFWCWNHHLSAPNISATCRSRCCPRWCVACGSAWLRASHTWRCMAMSQKPGARMVPYSSWFSWMLILPVISGFPENGGTPIAGWFIMKNPKIKWMFISWKKYNGWWMGYPHVRKPPYGNNRLSTYPHMSILLPLLAMIISLI